MTDSDLIKDLRDELLEEKEPSAPSYRCPNCNRPMTCLQFSYRPSWKLIMAELQQSKKHPEWFDS